MWLMSPSGMPLKLPWMSISAGPHWRHSLPMPTSSFCLSCLNALVEPLRQSHLRAIELLPGVVRQAAMANARTGQSLSAGYVGNLVNLRDAVLGRFTVPKRTQEILRGGDFTGDSLFAPLPESFSFLLDTVSGAELRCTSGSAQPKPPPSQGYLSPPISSQISSRGV